MSYNKIVEAKIVGKETKEHGLVFKKVFYYLIFEAPQLKDPVTQKNYVAKFRMKMEEFYAKNIGEKIKIPFESEDGFLWVPKPTME